MKSIFFRCDNSKTSHLKLTLVKIMWQLSVLGFYLFVCLFGWLVGWFYGVSTLFWSFNGELNFKQFSLVQI